MKTFITILLMIASFAIIAAVLVQDSKSEGLAAISAETNIGASGNVSTKDEIINRVVVISGVVFMVSAIILAIL